MPTGNVTGSIQQLVVCDGLQVNQSVAATGASAEKISVTAPAALAGTVLSQSGETLTIADPSTLLASGNTVAVFWFVGAVLHAMYDVTINTITSPGAAETVLLTVTTAKFLVAGDTTLPANATAITIAVAQDVTDGVAIVYSTLQMLVVTSAQPGMVELLDAVPTTQRASSIAAGGNFDAWITGTTADPLTANVVKCRFYNQAIVAANMTVKVILS
jgi:hypothetical protein